MDNNIPIKALMERAFTLREIAKRMTEESAEYQRGARERRIEAQSLYEAAAKIDAAIEILRKEKS